MAKTIDRFHGKYRVSDEYPNCWEWTGARNGNGRAAFFVDGKSILAHRYAYEQLVLAEPPIPENVEIRRSCSNPICVNPSHLYAYLNDAESRFFSEVEIDEAGHWYWEGNGPYKAGGISLSPRRAAWQFYRNEAPPTFMKSLCGEKDCISPEHCGSPEAAFWNKVDKNEDGHWYWTGKMLKSGYAHISRKGNNVYVHKVAWELSGGAEVDLDSVLSHICGIKHCVNPEHLEIISYQEMCRRRKPRGRNK